jgi:hypothetical protein
MKEFGIGPPSDWWQVEFHLDPAYTFEIPGVYLPFGSLAVTLEEIATTRSPDKIMQPEGGDR